MVTMSGVLLDSNILIDYLNGNQAIEKRIEQIGKEKRKLYISIINRIEILSFRELTD